MREQLFSSTVVDSNARPDVLTGLLAARSSTEAGRNECGEKPFRYITVVHRSWHDLGLCMQWESMSVENSAVLLGVVDKLCVGRDAVE
jgi:hypothetical protein